MAVKIQPGPNGRYAIDINLKKQIKNQTHKQKSLGSVSDRNITFKRNEICPTVVCEKLCLTYDNHTRAKKSALSSSNDLDKYG